MGSGEICNAFLGIFYNLPATYAKKRPGENKCLREEV